MRRIGADDIDSVVLQWVGVSDCDDFLREILLEQVGASEG